MYLNSLNISKPLGSKHNIMCKNSSYVQKKIATIKIVKIRKVKHVFSCFKCP